jgi:hypothetical protein
MRLVGAPVASWVGLEEITNGTVAIPPELPEGPGRTATTGTSVMLVLPPPHPAIKATSKIAVSYPSDLNFIVDLFIYFSLHVSPVATLTTFT